MQQSLQDKYRSAYGDYRLQIGRTIHRHTVSGNALLSVMHAGEWLSQAQECLIARELEAFASRMHHACRCLKEAGIDIPLPDILK